MEQRQPIGKTAGSGLREGYASSGLAQHRERLLRTARILCRDNAAAEDLVQETFCRAWSNQSRFRGESGLYTWLFGIFRHLFLDRLRGAGRQKRRETELPPQEAVLEGPEVALEAMSEQDRLRRVLRDLSPSHRDILLLRFAEERSLRGIAEHLDLPLGTVKSRLHLALRSLRGAWLKESNGRRP